MDLSPKDRTFGYNFVAIDNAFSITYNVSLATHIVWSNVMIFG